jgi:hypothetical protein
VDADGQLNLVAAETHNAAQAEYVRLAALGIYWALKSPSQNALANRVPRFDHDYKTP